jgi:hypothetical protein
MGLMSLLNYPMAGFMVFLLSKGVGALVLLKGFKLFGGRRRLILKRLLNNFSEYVV